MKHSTAGDIEIAKLEDLWKRFQYQRSHTTPKLAWPLWRGKGGPIIFTNP